MDPHSPWPALQLFLVKIPSVSSKLVFLEITEPLPQHCLVQCYKFIFKTYFKGSPLTSGSTYGTPGRLLPSKTRKCNKQVGVPAWQSEL